MTILEVKSIINIIISTSWDGKKRVDDLIVEKIYHSTQLIIDRDLLLDELGDPNTNSYEKLIRTLQSTLLINNNFNKIELFDEVDGFYIQKKHNNSAVDIKYSEVISFINSIELQYNKGVAYELFCKAFLEDLGIQCISTKSSGDKGIDILGSYFSDLKDNVANLVFNEKIYLLVQTKYFTTSIDTPVIRKLVGDSLFIRFDELDYLTIRHNAVHLIVFSHNGFTTPATEFALRNKVKIFDSTHIAHIISEEPEKHWNCLKIIFPQK
ncbi:restriction endonuclease [Flavobacterium hibisci]|uniref:restriction endonuclease n=1 Tax=Flavobacterium hibisci TaxID=1914462 RepID=UPI001CBF5EF7|nr:restriction endonuclease [Flavobacterium hibisci]MBZ4042411.1 restriction endonuclease [Flavobacterium hibisci]